MAGLPGKDLDPSTLRLICEKGINNFIIFKRNVQTPAQLTGLCRDIVWACRENDLQSPIISIDQEGGSVARLPPPFSQFAGARKLSESHNPENAVSDYARICAQELKNVGITMNLAPVLDVCPKDRGFFMEDRVYGSTYQEVVELGCSVIRVMQEQGIAACGKHFPGLGRAVLDPHERLPVVESSLEILEKEDFIPFVEAVSAGVAAIMTSHTIYTGLDHQYPATMSEKILTGLLRNTMKFDGVIITDDLEMGAIETNGLVSDASVKAFKAGADLLLICHDHNKVERAYDAMHAKISKGEITDARLQASLKRIQGLSDRFAKDCAT
ncbi:MAG: beta-N-acetylhexosaminidase [Proteobacteria bacterium]|nr:beta-N-acetylhexosaminidase [Pseudomonadota bacterium]MBU1708962.1 beta-N-acetylhexosaminidase [Pseudomonadota bacterium]